MYLVYGFKADIPERLLPTVCEIVQTISCWPIKSRAVIESVRNYGGMLLMRKPNCTLNDLCPMCRHCNIEERQNLHEFLDKMYRIGSQQEFLIQLKLIKFVSLHTTKLFTKHSRMPAITKISPSENELDHL